MFRVIGIDPGYERLGVAILDGTPQKQTLVYSTCIHTPKTASFEDRVHSAGTSLIKLLDEYKPTHLGIETLFFNKNQKTAFLVAQMRGVVLFLARERTITVCEYGPQAIKIAVTGYGKSTKDDVAGMLPRLISNIPTGVLDDEYDAIAAGVTCLVSIRP